MLLDYYGNVGTWTHKQAGKDWHCHGDGAAVSQTCIGDCVEDAGQGTEDLHHLRNDKWSFRRSQTKVIDSIVAFKPK